MSFAKWLLLIDLTEYWLDLGIIRNPLLRFPLDRNNRVIIQ